MEILALLIIIYACRQAVTDTRKASRKSRDAYMKSADARFPGMPKGKRAAHAARHDLGFGLGQARHGFPQARNGFVTGWHQSRQAHVQAMAEAQKAKTEHLETRAGLIPRVREYQARQQKALAQIRGGQPGTQTTGDDAPEAKGGEGSPVADSLPAEGGYSYGTKGAPSAWPTNDPKVAHEWAQQMSTGGSPQQVHRYPVKGKPGVLEATYVDGERVQVKGAPERAGAASRRKSSGFSEQLPPPDLHICPGCGYGTPSDGLCAACSLPKRETGTDTAVVTENGEPVTGEGSEGSGEGSSPEASPSTSPTEGDNAMPTGTGEVTYDGVLRGMTAAQADAEQKAAEADAAAKAASDTAEQMQALEMDPATLGAMADHLDAHAAAQTALARVQETAEIAKATLQRGHSGLSEAHKDAPVEAAAKPFYSEG